MSNADKIFDEIIGAPKVRNPELRRMIEERMAKGGLLKKMAKAFDLPPASAAQKTQIPGTEPTYRKAKDILDREKPEGRTLDYGSGLGIGSRVLGAESFEPFPREGVTPTFINPEDIPTEAFDRLVNLNMLNVVPRDVRDAAVENIGRVMRPGGMGLVTTRGKDVMKASGEPGPEANSMITSIGTYQKGFTPEELREYLKYILGSDYDIGRLNLGPAGAVVRKKGMKEGGVAQYGLRHDSGMPKGKGYFGPLKTDEGVMTELSAADESGDFPLLVPTLTKEEVQLLTSGGQPTEEIYAKAKAWAESRKGQGRDPFATGEDLRMPVPEFAKGGEVHAKTGGIGKNVGRGMTGLTRSRQSLDPNEIQAMMLDVPASIGVPFAEAGAEYLRGNIEDAKFAAGVDAALTAVPVVGMAAKPAYRAVKSGIQKAAPAAREAARGALESAMESGAIMDPRMYAVKPTGGQWLNKGFENRIIEMGRRDEPYPRELDIHRNLVNRYRKEYEADPTDFNLRSKERAEREFADVENKIAVNKWMDTNLQNYGRKYLGTKEDPVLKLAEQGILHMPYERAGVLSDVALQREAAGFPAEGTATTDLGQMWENMTDREIKQIAAGKITDPNYLTDLSHKMGSEALGKLPKSVTPLEASQVRAFRNFRGSGREDALENNPWLEKVDPKTPVYDIIHYDLGRKLGFDHVIDVLKEDLAAGRLRADQLPKMSVEQAVRRTSEYDIERAAAMAKAAEEEMKGMTIAQEFDDGYKMVQLDKPGQFAKESDRMGHSVRGYEPGRDSDDWIDVSGNSGYSSYGHGGWEGIKGGHAQVFSLRDAKNNPHVTIEVQTREGNKPSYKRAVENLKRSGYDENQQLDILYKGGYIDEEGNVLPDVPVITQIKGKQNAAPKEEYLPMIQKFIREGNYKVEGDLANAGLIDVRGGYGSRPAFLPDNTPRYITQSELDRIKRTGEFTPEFAKGGIVKKAVSLIEEAFKGDMDAAGRAAAGREAAKYIKSQSQVKPSEAFGQLMEKGFKKTATTQADRTRVGGGNIGGASFSALSAVDPNYAGKVWGVGEATTAARLANLSTPETAWTTMLGSATQLKTNPIVFDKLKREFKAAMKEGKLSPELEAKINKNLSLTFGEGAEIRDPSIWKQADTFEKRAALADIMMGQGIPPSKGGVALGGEKSGKGVIFRPTDILKAETEPGLLHPEHGGDVPTFAAGPRLFSLEKEFMYRPDLHPGFPVLMKGEDLGYSVTSTPTEVFLPDWHRRFKEMNPERQGPGYYDLALGVKGEGLPSQELSDAYIRHLLREGFKAGGTVKKMKKRSKNG